MKNRYLLFSLAVALIIFLPSCNSSKIKTLIITGQSSHNWPASSDAAKQILDETGMFSTKVLVTPPAGEDMAGFKPKFSGYKLVVIDFEGDKWSDKTIASFRDYINEGGGVLILNSKNDLIANYADSAKNTDRINFEIRFLAADHAVTMDLPVRWMHPDDILVRDIVPATDDVKVIATASADGQAGRGIKPVPVLLSRNFGKGRIFAVMMGNPDGEKNLALHCTGFIVILQRAAEWAATGSVTQMVPSDFPTAAGAVDRDEYSGIDPDEAFRNLGDYKIGKTTLYYTWLQNEIRKAAGNRETLLSLETKMVDILIDPASTTESKKLILKELSWMGSESCIPAIKSLESVPELKDEVSFALERLQTVN